MYHAVQDDWPSAIAVRPSDFDEQCRWLKTSGRVLPLEEWLRQFAGTGRFSRYTAITFDDGFASVYDTAFPILRRYGLPATVFVVGETVAAEGRSVDWARTRPPGPLRTLRPGQIREMCGSGITLGSHGHTHRDLTGLPPDECELELRESRVALEEVLDAPVRLLAYPFGRHNAAVRRAAHRAGYSNGFGTEQGREPLGPYGIPRAGVYPVDGGAGLAIRLKASRLYPAIRRSRLYPLFRGLTGTRDGRSVEATADAV